MENTLKGQVALVTGGTKGIGKAIADSLSMRGAQVIVTARTAPAENIQCTSFYSCRPLHA